MSNPPNPVDWNAAAQQFSASASKLIGALTDRVKGDGQLLASRTYNDQSFADDIAWFWTTLSATAADVADCWTTTLAGKSL
jgi:hypothetical protein